MRREPVSIVLVARSGAEITEACLASARPAMRPRDELILCAPAGAALPSSARQSWVRVIETATDGVRDQRAAGLAAAAREVVVFLDDDCLLPPQWLDPLAAAFADPEVVAAGPTSNLVGGSQGVGPVTYTGDKRADIAAYARQRSVITRDGTTRDEVRDVPELSDLALAVRRTTGAAANAELPTDSRRVVVTASYVHHRAVPTCFLRTHPPVQPGAPLLSASLIVRDEEDLIGDCLASLQGVCEEIVVYDTGSTDRTRDIARGAGVQVIEGYWNESFADARNRALAACTGQWVLVVDADERLQGTAAEIRKFLVAASGDGFLVGIESAGQGGRTTGRAGGREDTVRSALCRLFRRSAAEYAGRLHEQVVHRRLGSPLRADHHAPIRLLHLGYESERVTGRGKIERNLRMAQQAVDELSQHGVLGQTVALAALARAQLAAGRAAEALATVDRAELPKQGGHPGAREVAEAGVIAAVALNRGAEARTWVERLRQAGEEPHLVAFYEAAVLAEEGRPTEALQLLERWPDAEAVRDPLLPRDPLVIRLLEAAGRTSEAADLALDALRRGAIPAPLPLVLRVILAAGRPLDDLAAAVPADLLPELVGETLAGDLSLTEPLLSALHARYPSDRRILAAAARRSREMSVQAALDWSARLRAVGLHLECPLVAVADTELRSPRDRLLAAALAAEAFADPRAHEMLPDLGEEIPDDVAENVLAELRMLAPGVAAMFEVAGEPAQLPG